MNYKNRFQKLKPWQKGLVIGFGIDLVRLALLILIFPYILNLSIKTTNIIDHLTSTPINFIIPLFGNWIPFTIYGLIIGLIIEIFQKKEQEKDLKQVSSRSKKTKLFGILLIVLSIISAPVVGLLAFILFWNPNPIETIFILIMFAIPLILIINGLLLIKSSHNNK